MKIFVSHSSSFDFENQIYIPLRNSEINKQHEISFPHENGKDVITKDIIKDSNLVVAEISFSSTGQGIELGWADVFNIPVVCIFKTGSKYSKSIGKLTENFIEYDDSPDMIEKLSKYINNGK